MSLGEATVGLLIPLSEQWARLGGKKLFQLG